MSNKRDYNISSVGEFYEVFDWMTKETVFVSESPKVAQQALMELNKYGFVQERTMNLEAKR